MKPIFTSIYSVALATFAMGATAAEVYPTLLSKPVDLYRNRTYSGKVLSLVEETALKELSRLAGEKVKIISLYALQEESTANPIVCGRGSTSLRSEVRFVILQDRSYWDVPEDGWQRMGCNATGVIKVTVRHISEDRVALEFRDQPKPTAPTSRANIAAVPTGGPLPPGVRQRLAIRWEDSLSQLFGKQVTLLSYRSYKEQDGSSTTCTTGLVGGRRFRMASIGNEPIGDPTQAQWVAAGCVRPDYQLLR